MQKEQRAFSIRLSTKLNGNKNALQMTPIINKKSEVKIVVLAFIFRYCFYLHVESNRIEVAGSYFSILFSTTV
jgi:hypothetical protein